MEEVTREDVVAKDVSSAPVAYADADELRLSQLGYKQAREPRRWVAASWHAFCQVPAAAAAPAAPRRPRRTRSTSRPPKLRAGALGLDSVRSGG